jgi:hypothetical protein
LVVSYPVRQHGPEWAKNWKRESMTGMSRSKEFTAIAGGNRNILPF